MSRRVSNWIEGFLQYTSNTEPRESYRRWVAISTIASVLQRKCKLEWGMERFYPNLYVVLVGPPAARKGTAMKAGRLFLDKLGINISADESSRPKLVQSLQESLAAHQNQNGNLSYHASLTIFATELTVFLGYEAKDLLGMLCKLYDCEDQYVYDTISRGREEVPNVWVNLLGATTPGQLQASVPEGFVGSGFTSRIVFIYEDNKARIIIKPTLTPSQLKLRDELVQDLAEIHTFVGDFDHTEEFEKLYGEWRTKTELGPEFADSRLEYYAQRRPAHLLKLCMIYSAARNNSMRLDKVDLQLAEKSLASVEENMPQVFRGMGSNPLAGIQARLAKALKENGELPSHIVSQMFFSDATHRQLGEAVAALEAMGVCKIDPINRKLIYSGE